MGINLSNLNISLDQFNAVASGKYNIGQLKVGADGASVYRTNNHKTLTFLNGEFFSPEESIALKSAFCRALASEGLSSEDIDAVKERLGIAGGAVDAVRVGGATPLSAADVRQIIDEYAEKINARRAKAEGAEALQTSSEIYQGVSQNTLASRAAARASVNARTVEQMMSTAAYSVNTLLDMLKYTGKDKTATMNLSQTGTAREILERWSELSKGKSIKLETTTGTSLSLSQAQTVVATFSLEDGNTFSVDTGLDTDALRHQMNVVLGKAQADKAGESNKPEESKKTGEPDKTEESRKADKSGKAVGDAKQELLEELKRAFADARDKQIMNKKAKDALRTVPTHNKKTNEPLGADARMTLAQVNARKSLTAIVDPLQKALSKARPNDNDNVKLVNQVRKVLAGNEDIDTEDLLNRIKTALDKKIVNSRDKVAEELEKDIEVDLDNNLNINAWLEQS